MTQEANQAPQEDTSSYSWETRHMIAFSGVLVIGGLVVIAAFRAIIAPFWIWMMLLAVLVVMTLLLSRAYTRRWLGILIDERNKYSLSRLQMAMWTIIILSAFVAAVLANVQLKLLVYVSGAIKPAQVFQAQSGTLVADILLAAGVLQRDENGGCCSAVEGFDLSRLDMAETVHDGQQIYVPAVGDPNADIIASITKTPNEVAATTPLSVQIPNEVWLLLGISTTSLVASPLIKGQKRRRIQNNPNVAEARFGDLVKGEEESNFLGLDLAKVQMFYFTLIVIGAYMIALASMLTKSQNAITSLPGIDGGVVALLGVSHAGYLTNKAVPRPGSDDLPSGSSPPPPPQPNTPNAAG